MAMTDQIDELFKKAMSDKDEVSLSVARLLKSALKNAEIEKRGELSDDDVLAVLEKQAKQRRDSIEQYKKGGRPELAEKEKQELAIIEKFLPEKLDENEVRKVVKEKVAAIPEAQFGQVMGAVMSELKGKADGGTVSKILKEELGQ